jgi:cytochrome c oxidase subunit 2
MKFRVVAQTPEDFDRWVAEQKAPASTEVSGPAAAGKEIFQQTCTACHAVAGLESANGQPALANGAPNLTHLMSRECFRGCTLDVDEENLRRWVADPRSIEAGSFMPDYGLSADEVDQVVAFLMTLE